MPDVGEELVPEPKLEEELPKLLEELPKLEEPVGLPMPGPDPTGVLPAG